MATYNIVKLSDLENFKDFSAEYYKKEYVDMSSTIRKIGSVRASQVAFITDGEHGSPCWDSNSDIKYITAEYIKENYIEQGEYKHITKEQDNRNARARLQKDDVLIYSVGAYAGFAAVAEPHLFPANIPRSVAILRLNPNSGLNAEYVSVFLNSKYGKFQTLRLRAGNSQPVLALDKIRQLEIPVIEQSKQDEIKKLYQDAYRERLGADSLYKEAEDLLERKLRINNIVLSNKRYYTVHSKSILSSNRMDAEFYNQDLLQYYEYLEKNGLKMKSLSSMVDIKKFSNPTYSENGVPIVTQRHLNKISPENYGDYPLASSSWCNTNKEAVLKKNDILYYSVGAYLGKANIWLNEDKAVFASFITLLRCKNVEDSAFLIVLLNSKFGILQSKTYQSGTSQPYIYPKDLSNFKIPDIDIDIKKLIYDKLCASYIAHKKSKENLTLAEKKLESYLR